MSDCYASHLKMYGSAFLSFDRNIRYGIILPCVSCLAGLGNMFNFVPRFVRGK